MFDATLRLGKELWCELSRQSHDSINLFKKKDNNKIKYAPDHRSNRRTMTKPAVAVLYFTYT